MSELTRRRLLRAAAVAAPAVLLPLRPWQQLVDVEPASAAVRLAGAVSDRESARAVGAAYLRSHEHDAAQLVAALRRGVAERGVDPDRAGRDDLRAALAECVAADFRAEAIAPVGGWVLSRTEAQLCALAELLARER